MKAIHINIDPYLQAVADWLNAGKPGTVPSFDPLPVAVTIPLGESACIYVPGVGPVGYEPDPNSTTISGQTVRFRTLPSGDVIPDDAIDTNVAPGLSALAPSAKYWVEAVDGDTSLAVIIDDGDEVETTITFTVLVRRETASGPVDLVDFTPPATLTAAQINTALGGTGAEEGSPLAGVLLNETKYLMDGETDPSSLSNTTDPISELGGLYGFGLTSPGS